MNDLSNEIKGINFAGAVVWYNPIPNVLDNINSYISKLRKLFIIDNSDSDNSVLLLSLPENVNVEYISSGKNLGIAKALNIAAEKAVKEGFNWLFTFDDDSKASETMIDEMRSFFSSNQFSDKIAIVAPFHSNKNYKMPPEGVPYVRIADTMTSGNLLNLTIYKKIGKFREDFFIDYVDKEYCLRVISAGYSIYQVNKAVLYHNLGRLQKRRFAFRYVSVTHHSPLRLYYRTRNRLQVIKEYSFIFPAFCIKDFIGIFTDILKILIYEEQKTSKLKMIFKGAFDFMRNKFGKLKEIN
ncbi:MAG: glycosyltransferase family 2 protein [archaeon]